MHIQYQTAYLQYSRRHPTSLSPCIPSSASRVSRSGSKAPKYNIVSVRPSHPPPDSRVSQNLTSGAASRPTAVLCVSLSRQRAWAIVSCLSGAEENGQRDTREDRRLCRRDGLGFLVILQMVGSVGSHVVCCCRRGGARSGCLSIPNARATLIAWPMLGLMGVAV